MMDMITAEILAIVGFFGTLALSVNAYFLRGIYSKQQEIEIKITELLVKEKEKERRIEKLEDNEQEIFKRLNEIEKKARWDL